MQLTRDERRMNEKQSARLRFQATDETGAPLKKADIATLVISLWEEESGDRAAINSRTDQNALDVNNVAIQADLTVSAATAANPCVVTFSGNHNLSAGMKLKLTGLGGMTELNDRVFTVIPVEGAPTQVQLQHTDATGYTAYTSAGSGYAGLVTWSIQAADNAIVASTAVASYEEHRVLFEWTFPETPTLEGNWEQIIEVLSMAKVS